MTYLNTTLLNPAALQAQSTAQATRPSIPSAVATQTVAQDQWQVSHQPAGFQSSAVQFNAPAAQSFSPYTPTLTQLSISREALQWATEFEARVQQGHQPNAEEVSYYQSLANQLSLLRENIQPLSPTPALPQVQNWNQPQQSAPQQAPAGDAFGPGMPPLDQQVTMSEIEWALIVEDKVQKYGYKPTPEEEKRYQNILTRFKNNSEIKMEFLDSLAAQSPWVGANVAGIRYGKIVANQVSEAIGAIKSGTGSVIGSLKAVGGTLLKSTGLSALVSGGFSAVTNGIAYMQGKKTATQAVSNVVTDTVTGAATGLGATLAGGAAMMALAGTSVAGFGLTLLVGGASILGGFLADKVLTKTGAKEWIKSKTIAMMDGMGKPQQQQPQQAAAPQAPAQQPAYGY
ncbi:MAG: hypothetical protein IGS03_08455 [Candidatus Sericytochromatia bacterium]|nr:hypothetical protein [Candidatus Sericytochromatia bacterium]